MEAPKSTKQIILTSECLGNFTKKQCDHDSSLNVASCQNMRSLSLGKVVIATSLAFAGLWMISVVAMEEPAEEVYEDVILPICGKKAIANKRPDVLLVSTLDGKLSALDPNNDGKLLWSIGTGPGSMLSSTISQMGKVNFQNS